MQIDIDPTTLATAINNTATKAIADALDGYDVRQAIAKVITREVADGVIAEAIRQAIKGLDTAKLASVLAGELERATIRATVKFLQEGMLHAICQMRGIGDYSEADKRARALLAIELFGRREG